MPNTSIANAQTGFTLLELALVTLMVAVLFTVALTRFLNLMVDAERVHLLQVEGALKSALGLELTRRVVERELDSIADLAGDNPMGFIKEKPQNYLGESNQPDLEALPGGVWVFDLTRQALIYTVRNSDHFHSDLPGRTRVEYRLELQYDDSNRNGRFDYGFDHLSGLQLASLGNSRWLDQRD